MNNRIRMRMLPFAIASLLAVGPVMAQSTSSAIAGRVTDASGQPVAGATVTIVHEPSQTSRTVTTGADGRYAAQGLRVGGPFDVTASKGGMPQGERDNVYLQLGQQNAVNLTLAPSSANAQNLADVTVSANAQSQVFSPDNKGLSTNISQRELESLPTPGRSIQDIARLDPRVVITDGEEGKISALGQNYRYNNITVDSVGANDPFGLNSNGLPTSGTPISQDTIAEYNISTANFDVANRRGLGANINAVTKSGTNEFHGSVYYVYQNDDMIGNLNGDKYTGFQRTWTGGATVGGPIIKDKLFFFASYEKSKQIGAGGGSYGPEGSSSGQEIRDLSQADVQAIRDAAAAYGLDNLGGYGGGNSDLTDKRSLAKLDWNINDNHRASFTYQRTKEIQPNPPTSSSSKLVLASNGTLKATDNKSYALHLYDDWSDSFSSDTTLSYAHYNRTGGPLTGVELPDITVHTDTYKSPSVEFGTNYSYQANAIDTKTLMVSWAGTWYLNDHTLKFGFDYEHDKKYNVYLPDYFGSYSFDSLDDFKAGKFSSYYYNRPADGLTLDQTAAKFSLKQYGLFLQDTWQFNDNLSVQYGFRVDLPQTDDVPLFNQDFADAGFVTSTGQTLTTNQYTTNNKRVIQPRVSFNYSFDTERKMQLRGGYGLFITDPPAVWIGNIYANSGVNVTGFNCTPRYGCTPPAFSPDPHNQNDVVGAGSGGTTVNTLDPNFRLPSAWKTTLAYDAELPWLGLIGSVDYEHIEVRNAIWYQDLNLGTPTGTLPDGRNTFYKVPDGDPRARGQKNRANANGDFGPAVINLANTDKGSADNLTLSLKKPFHNNWSAMVGVTWGRSSDVNPGLSSVANSSYKQAYVTNPNENVASTSNYNVGMRAIASLSWRHAFFGNYYTGVSAFYNGQQGHPYSWAFGNDANGDSFYNDLAFIPKQGQIEFKPGTDPQMEQQFYNYINDTKYLKDHQGAIAQRNGARAPWFNRVDLSFSQEIPGLFKGNKGEIRLDIQNFGNLLNSKWGHEKRADFPGVRNLADFYGVDPATGKYIYDISGSRYVDKDGNYAPQSLDTYVDSYGSYGLTERWSVQLTVRYKF